MGKFSLWPNLLMMLDCDWELKWQHINKVHSHVATLSLSAVSVPGLMNVQRQSGLKKSNCTPTRSSSYQWWKETLILHLSAFLLALHLSTFLSKTICPCDFNNSTAQQHGLLFLVVLKCLFYRNSKQNVTWRYTIIKWKELKKKTMKASFYFKSDGFWFFITVMCW